MRKKLIEVALPLEAINEASAREKSIRHGHPSTLHLWWARRPLAAARAVIFASLVDDPDHPEAPPALVQACRELPKGRNATANDTPRMRLFDFIETLVQWESTTDEAVIGTARRLIVLATDGNPPPLLDPFAGGGSIPLEAQRLGLEAHASDLNPVAVMINKAQIEIPPRFANRPPVNPEDRDQKPETRSQTEGSEAKRSNSKRAQGKLALTAAWKGTAGLAADVRYYGQWMRDEAFKRIGHLYPTLAVVRGSDGKTRAATPDEIAHPKSQIENETVIAQLWARTVTCPNPACGCRMPLVRSFELSKKKGKETWVEPICEKAVVRFAVRGGGGKPPEGTVNRRGARCVCCGTPVPFDHVRAEGRAGRMGAQLMAIVTEGQRGRNYYAPTPEHEAIAQVAIPADAPDTDLPEQALGFRVQAYGMTKHRDLFTARQLVALTTFSDLVAEAREQCARDAVSAGLPDDDLPLHDGGAGARAYAEAMSVYLAFAVDRLTDRCCSLATWQNSADKVRGVFSRQAIPMVWDFAEVNVFSQSSGNFLDNVGWSAEVLDWGKTTTLEKGLGLTRVFQQDAVESSLIANMQGLMISTDPPYYDNIGYADLSDFFYVWMRPSLKSTFPEIFGTLLVPKTPELIAAPHRHNGDWDAASAHFENGLQRVFLNSRQAITRDIPLTVYYAFKQTESDEPDDENETNATVSTGWETMLSGLIGADFVLDGTWPMRTERSVRSVGLGTNALASSIVLVCRPRPDDAPTASRRQFVDALRRELPAALKELQSGNIAPVDLAQASIGPGMAIYSRFSKVLEADGSPLTVRAALGLINQELDAYLEEQDGSVDPDTRFAVAWFQQYGFGEGEFGVADVLARAKNTSVDGVAAAGVARAGRGKVQLVGWRDYDAGAWSPESDRRLTAWEATHHLIERLNTRGEDGAGLLLAQLSDDLAAEARALAYRLYSICERKGWAEHARDYNALVVQWTGVQERAKEAPARPAQGGLFG